MKQSNRADFPLGDRRMLSALRRTEHKCIYRQLGGQQISYSILIASALLLWWWWQSPFDSRFGRCDDTHLVHWITVEGFPFANPNPQTAIADITPRWLHIPAGIMNCKEQIHNRDQVTSFHILNGSESWWLGVLEILSFNTSDNFLQPF